MDMEHYVWHCCYVAMSAEPEKKDCVFIFEFAGTNVFLFCFFVWSSLFYPASLYYFCSVAHQENSQAYLSMFIIVFPLLTYTHDRQQHGCDEGEWRGRCWWACSVLAKTMSTQIFGEKMGHCLSAASLTAFSHKNWSAFVDTLILMRANPLFSPQWIHR